MAHRPQELRQPKCCVWRQTSQDTQTSCTQLEQAQTSKTTCRLTLARAQGDTACNANLKCVFTSVHRYFPSLYPHTYQHDAWHHLSYTAREQVLTTSVARHTDLRPQLFTYMSKASKVGKAVTVHRPYFLRSPSDSTDSSVSDMNAKSVHHWRQTCHHNLVSSQAIQAYELYLTNGVYMQRSLAAWRYKQETSSRTFDLNVSTIAWSKQTPAGTLWQLQQFGNCLRRLVTLDQCIWQLDSSGRICV